MRRSRSHSDRRRPRSSGFKSRSASRRPRSLGAKGRSASPIRNRPSRSRSRGRLAANSKTSSSHGPAPDLKKCTSPRKSEQPVALTVPRHAMPFETIYLLEDTCSKLSNPEKLKDGVLVYCVLTYSYVS